MIIVQLYQMLNQKFVPLQLIGIYFIEFKRIILALSWPETVWVVHWPTLWIWMLICLLQMQVTVMLMARNYWDLLTKDEQLRRKGSSAHCYVSYNTMYWIHATAISSFIIIKLGALSISYAVISLRKAFAKGAKDEVKRPRGLQLEVGEGPLDY